MSNSKLGFEVLKAVETVRSIVYLIVFSDKGFLWGRSCRLRAEFCPERLRTEGFSVIKNIVIFKQELNAVQAPGNMEVTGKPSLIGQFPSNFLQPFFCGIVCHTLVKRRQKGVLGHGAQWHRVREHIIYPPVDALQSIFHPLLDVAVRLFSREPRGASGNAIAFFPSKS